MARVKCEECGTVNNPEIRKKCRNCGERLPLLEDENEEEEEPAPRKSSSSAKKSSKRRNEEEEEEDYESRKKKKKRSSVSKEGAILLWVLGGLNVLVGIVLLTSKDFKLIPGMSNNDQAIISFVSGMVLAGLGAWAFFKPFVPLLLAGILYVFITIGELAYIGGKKNVQINPGPLIVRVVIIAALFRGSVRSK